MAQTESLVYYEYALAQMAADSYLDLRNKYGLTDVLKLGNNNPDIPSKLVADTATLSGATRFTDKMIDDLAITDGGDIVVDGVASSQIIDLYNYWMALKTPAVATYQKARVEAASTVLDAEFAWRTAA